MSIIINCMEMPTSCPCELLGIGYDLYCSFAGGIPARVKEYYECCQNGTRPSWCPLVPVPPHGDLIDRDALIDKVIAKYLEHERMGQLVFAAAEIKQDICDLISDAPTIIPASEEEM